MPETDPPLVSVLMPAYNHERFVATSIMSVVDQTYRPLELVIVDDGSTDSTRAVITSLAEEATRRLDGFVFESQRNRGIPKTLNRTLRHARGEFVATIGSDDAYLPHKIERLVSAPEWADPSTGVLFGDAYVIDEQGNQVGVLEDQSTTDAGAAGAETLALAHYLRYLSDPEPGPLGSYANLLRSSYIPALSTLIRHSVMREVGGYDEHLFVEDYALWLRIARSHRIVSIPDVVAQKRFHGQNAAIDERRRIFRDVLDIMVSERRYARSDPAAEAARASSRDRAYDALRDHGTTTDLLRVIARRPLAASRDLFEAQRHATARERAS